MSDHEKHPSKGSAFASEIVDRARHGGGVWTLPGGQILLPSVFGFCRGVTRALEMLEQSVAQHGQGIGADINRPQRLFLLGQIIHNPWVNAYFQRQGVRMLSREDLGHLESIITADDVAIIPAFGVPLPIEQRLAGIGCRIVDTSCGDVRRLWSWAQKAAGEGFGVLIFGRADHDETVVTRSRLEACGGKYVVAGKLEQVRQFCGLVSGQMPASKFRECFGANASNADSLSPFERLAQVSQTTMLYDETMTVRELITQAFAQRFGPEQAKERLLFQPTVCKATQARQAAAVELCQSRPDVVIVVGGFGSSNTRHLYELARQYAAAYFIEDARAILDERHLATADDQGDPRVVENWLPSRRPLRLAVLAGASSPEVVIGQVMQKLAAFLA